MDLYTCLPTHHIMEPAISSDFYDSTSTDQLKYVDQSIELEL